MRLCRLLPIAVTGTLAVSAAAFAQTDEPIPEFTVAYLSDPQNVSVGEVVWREQCSLCHGAKAYPGKAPKLKPRRYTPDFVFKRVTNGFRKMPPWKDIYTFEERMGVAAYVLSKDFSP